MHCINIRGREAVIEKDGGGRIGWVGDPEGQEGKDMVFLSFPVVPFPQR